MGYLISAMLSLAVAVFVVMVGFARERAFYPTMLIVIASYYVLFGVMGASGRSLGIEIVVAGGFLLVAVMGFKRNLWWVVAAMVGHGVFDCFHHLIIENPGVPHWWPGFCLTFDVIFGGVLSVYLRKHPELVFHQERANSTNG